MPTGTVRWVHVNPTAINGKIHMLHQLQAAIICCSETRATTLVQIEATRAFRELGYSSVWSHPAAPHRTSDNPAPELRGKATGLSLHPHFGSMVIQVIQLYGYPRHMPTVFVGDLNHPPTSLPSIQALLDHGYKTSEQIYQDLYQEQQPPTCRGATRNDAFLFSKHLVPWISAVFVRSHAEFADHAPIGVEMKVPKEALTKTILRRPQSWLERAPEARILRETYAPLHQQGPPDSFAQWSSRCEQAVHKAIQVQHAEQPEAFPFQGLARAQRVRCKTPKFVNIQIPQPLKPAGPTQYNPQINQATAAFRQSLRQLRRIQSLYRRMTKLHRMPQMSPDWCQLASEWQAICNAKLWERPFCKWLLRQPEFPQVPHFLPSLEYLHDVQQMCAHQVRQLEAQEKKRQQQAQTYQRLYDRKWGSNKQAFRALRKPSNPCIQEVWQTHTYRIPDSNLVRSGNRPP